MKVEEWFGFLGSYLGVLGTILIGVIAFKQTAIINEQNTKYNELQQQMNILQGQLTDFQIHPIIQIINTSIEVVNDPQKPVTTARDIENYYFAIYGNKMESAGTRYIKIKISFEDKGLIPTVECEITKIEWAIASNSYSIQLNGVKQKIGAYDTLNVFIDDKDEISDKEAFFHDLSLHEHFNSNGLNEYDKSILTLTVTFFNQKRYSHPYTLVYWIRSVSGKLAAESMFLRSEREEYEEE